VKLRQDFFERSWKFPWGAMPSLISPLNEEEEEGLLPPELPEVPAYKK
jgi:hypothetical protein